MSVKQRTLEEVRREGLEVLVRELGPADFLRFLQSFGMGYGDYTEERQAWLGQSDVATLVKEIEQRRTKQSEKRSLGDGQPEADGD